MIEREDQGQEEPPEKAQEGPKLEARFIPTEQREEYDSTRRSEEERRQRDESPPDGEERREAHDRRKVDNRRGMAYGILYKTAAGMTQIEDWLEDYCQGKCSLVLTELDDELVKKSFRIMFELKTDKDEFIEKFIKG